MAAGKIAGMGKTVSADKWKRIGERRRAGVVAPLFSVYSKQTVGIGDLADLRLLADLCEKTGDTIIQLLPMNETGAVSCPYDAVSSFAIEPLYLCLRELPAARDQAVAAKIAKLAKAFPAGQAHVDYALKDAKLKLLSEIFLLSQDELKLKAFTAFCAAEEYWLEDYALFKVLKAADGGKPWYEWEEGYSLHDEDALDIIRSKHAEAILFQKWLQWHLMEQFRAAKEYANAKGILLKGDLPVLVSHDSADVWANPQFFKLDFAAGAPPDMYCAKGQRWGMPTYNWDVLAEDDYTYHKEKLRYAERFYDIIRVDHVVGLFRIWSISRNDPPENEGLNGSFDPKDENLWGGHGQTIISMLLDSTDMLLCAEDLGIIPKVCFDTLKEYGIPGNDVQRWVKDWTKRHDFLDPDEYRELAVAMLSTHDTTNWAGWWENEAGTVDEMLFVRKCADRGIDFAGVKGKLFDPKLSRHARLRWRPEIETKEMMIGILGKRPEELMDFIDLYENSFKEKEKLWKHFGFKGSMREKSDDTIVEAALAVTMTSNAVYCIELIFDRLFVAGLLKGDPYQYRVNRPGTVRKDNWSLTLPIALEELIEHDMCGKLKALAQAGKRL